MWTECSCVRGRQSLLRVANLRKTYDAAHQPYVALDGVDIEILEWIAAHGRGKRRSRWVM